MTGNANSGCRLSAERKALLDAAIADGWPIRQIITTYGIGTRTVKKHHPEYHGMSQVEAGRLGMSIRRTAAKLARVSPVDYRTATL